MKKFTIAFYEALAITVTLELPDMAARINKRSVQSWCDNMTNNYTHTCCTTRDRLVKSIITRTIKTILNTSSDCQLLYVPTQLNIADALTRGSVAGNSRSPGIYACRICSSQAFGSTGCGQCEGTFAKPSFHGGGFEQEQRRNS
jgi:hypothetical protein